MGDCEDKIKEEYGIPKSKSLYILKIDVKQKGLKIPKIEYEVYYPLFGESLIKLNLTVCQGSKIDLSIPVELTESIDKMNSSSNYYNDICYTYTSEDGTDISLADRKKEFIDNNLTVCEEDCDFVDYDHDTGKAICSCKVKTNSTTKIGDIVIDKDKLYNSFTNFKNIANINVLKCYRLIFILEAYKSNYANLILLAVILLFIIVFFIFICKDYNELMKVLNMIIFFKLNPVLIKKFKERLKKELNEKKPKPKKIIKKKKILNNINTKNNADSKSEVPLYRKIGDKMIKRPLFFHIWKVIQEDKNRKKDAHEPTKKKKVKRTIFDYKNNKNKNIDIINNKKLPIRNLKKEKDIIKADMNILPTRNDFPEIIIDKDEIIGNLSDEEIYEKFLIINRYTPEELNGLPYKIAVKNDKRSYCMYYISLIRTKHLLFFSFMPIFDYNSRILKIFLFFFNFTVNFVVNALFFNDDTMHKIYSDKGDFDFIYNLPQILYSAAISGFINALIQAMALTSSSFINLKEKGNKNNIKKIAEETKTIIKIKAFLFFAVSIALLVAFWFYLGCFCAVYRNTQIHLIKDTLISFGTSMIYPFAIYIIPGIFRIPSLKKKDSEFMYKFSKAIQILV